MKVLVLGASGATGKQLVKQLIDRGINTRIVVREKSIMPTDILDNPLIDVIRGSISDFTDIELEHLLEDINSVVSCLGHNISFKGMYGKPHNLVFDCVKNIKRVIDSLTNREIKFVLMSTTAYTNKSIYERNSFWEKFILTLLYGLLPPHRDNMKAGNYLIRVLGSNSVMPWIAVRPDTLIDDDSVTPYDVVKSPIRSPIFNAGVTSRINVSHFMAEVLCDNDLWDKWVFQTPVIYNK